MKKVLGVVRKVYLPNEKIGGELVTDLYGFDFEARSKDNTL